jgi:hypothetical protein
MQCLNYLKPRFPAEAVLSLCSVLLFLSALHAVAQDFTNTNEKILSQDWGESQKSFWRNAKPYLDDSLPNLEKELPELQHLQPAPNQDRLSTILTHVGHECVGLLERTPDVIAEEQVSIVVDKALIRREKFGYLVLVQPTPNGLMLQDYRTDNDGLRVADPAMGSGEGFASMWVHLFPGNQSESKFRYLGNQEVDKHKVIVLAFAQIPDKVKFPPEFVLPGGPILVFYQGIAWIDPDNWRIIRMREDLLAPRPDVKLTRFTAMVRLGAVTARSAGASLWLPREADLAWNLSGQKGRQRYTYSHYRLYEVQTKIITAQP